MAKKAQASGGVTFVRENDADAVGRKAAELVADQLDEKANSTFIFPTGNTPLPMYKALRHMPHLHWDSARLFHLDEYVKPPGQKGPVPYETYEEYMRRELWDCISGRKYYFSHFDGDPAGYEKLVNEKGGPDLVVLGIGANGHLAFNEPGSDPNSPARVIDLADKTIVSNFGSVGKRGFPTQAMSLGLKTILSAKKIILLATGSSKQAILRRAFDPNTPATADIPASWLKQPAIAKKVTVITDFDV